MCILRMASSGVSFYSLGIILPVILITETYMLVLLTLWIRTLDLSNWKVRQGLRSGKLIGLFGWLVDISTFDLQIVIYKW